MKQKKSQHTANAIICFLFFFLVLINNCFNDLFIVLKRNWEEKSEHLDKLLAQ